MVAIISPSFRVSNAKLFKASLSEPTYLAVGRTIPWQPTDLAPVVSELDPPIPGTSAFDTFATYNQSIGAKRLNEIDCSQSVRRIDWTTATVYDQYDYKDHELISKNFYVLVFDEASADHLNVYKCLSNNVGTASTTRPSGSSTTPITTADGYVWKFMLKIDPLKFQKFATSQFIPVTDATLGDGSLQATVQATAVSGTIDNIIVTAAGTGYASAPSVVINGDGTGATATATVSAGGVTKITITNRGSGYTYASVVISGVGTLAAAYAGIAPAGGHGSSATNELFAHYASVDVSLEYDEAGTISTQNEVRSVMVVQNPTNPANTAFTGANARLTVNLTYTGLSGTLQLDEILTDSITGATGRIVNITPTNVELSTVVGVFGANAFTTDTSISSGAISAVDATDIKIGSGEVLYVENRRPIQRDPAQTERYNIVFEW